MDGSEEKKPEVKAILERLEAMHDIEPRLAADTVRYIFAQLDDATLRGKINFFEYDVLLRRSTRGLLDLVYLGHFSRDVTKKRYFLVAAETCINLLYTRVLDGLDYKLILEEINSRRPVLISASGQTAAR